jgi:carbamoyl-phosphate synthase / aspartate carbamoyltransferase
MARDLPPERIQPTTRILPQTRLQPDLQSTPSSSSPTSLNLNSIDNSTSSPTHPRRPNKDDQSTFSLIRTVSAQSRDTEERRVYLELKDGTVYEGFSFGAEHSAAGEIVFQTGMVGYPESITDPSYRGQLLVMTFPLLGNYGVPSQEIMDETLKDLPKYFESAHVQIAGLIVASYCGEDFSHHLAKSSLGMFLKEHDVPAMYGVDTRALTRRIREDGSMLGRMLLQEFSTSHDAPNGVDRSSTPQSIQDKPWASETEAIDWIDPNVRNLVREGR